MKQREIKFRAWDDISKTFALPGEDEMYITLVGQICSTEEQDDDSEIVDNRTYRFTLQQFTGLTDANGKEIFEGDVVKTDQNSLSRMCVDWREYDNGKITWMRGGWYVCEQYKGATELHTYAFPDPESSGLVVIGNIYENPELLTT